MLIREVVPADPAAARERIRRLSVFRRDDLAGLSRMLGRPAGYLSRHVREGRPERLREEEARSLARYFGVDARELGAPTA